MFQESFKGVSQKFHGYFKKVSRIVQVSSKDVSRKFQGYFEGVLREYQRSF